ncbi:hypothetical protein EES46_03430 [Streptomyces sp. ADI98-10]|nr:hypothetical protein EES46_03430 [Streptomyces sp. ADI98-10]
MFGSMKRKPTASGLTVVGSVPPVAAARADETHTDAHNGPQVA